MGRPGPDIAGHHQWTWGLERLNRRENLGLFQRERESIWTCWAPSHLGCQLPRPFGLQDNSQGPYCCSGALPLNCLSLGSLIWRPLDLVSPQASQALQLADNLSWDFSAVLFMTLRHPHKFSCLYSCAHPSNLILTNTETFKLFSTSQLCLGLQMPFKQKGPPQILRELVLRGILMH